MTDPAPKQPEPVLNAAKLGGLVAAAFVAVGGAYFLIVRGITEHNLTAVGAAIEGAITAVVALAVYVTSVIHGKAAAAQVTPLSSPRDAQGRRLTPVDEYGRHAAKYQQGGYVGPPGETVTPRLSSDYVISGEQAKAKFLDQLNSKEQPRVSTKEWADSVREIMRSAQPSSGRRGRSC